MKSPEHLNIVKPESDKNESEINEVKLRGRKLIEDINKLISEGEIEEDKDKRQSLKRQAEEKLKELAKLKRKLHILKGKESESSLTPEQYLTDVHPFMIETYKDKWSYNEEQLKTVEEVTSNSDNIHIDEEIPFDEMKSINSDSRRLETNKSQAGEIYLTSETPDFESSKPFIPDIPEDIKSQGVGGVMKYIHETYSETHILPDIKYYQYLAQLGDQFNKETDPKKKEELLKQIPEQLQDGNYYFFPGSALVRRSGNWCVPSLNWDGDRFDRDARGVQNDWVSYYRFLLLER